MAVRSAIVFVLFFACLHVAGQQKQGINRLSSGPGLVRMEHPGVLPDFLLTNAELASYNKFNSIRYQPGVSLFKPTLSSFPKAFFRSAGKLQARAFLDTICIGQSVQLSAFGAGAKRFKWLPANGLSAPFDTLPNPVVNPTSTTTYMVIGSNETNHDTAFVKVTVLPKPSPVSVSGSNSVCPQVQNVWYKASNLRRQPLVWGVKGGAITTITNDSVAVNWGLTNAAAKVWVVPKNYLGCPGDTVFFPVQVNVILATARPAGPDSLCRASAMGVRYKILSTTGSVYTWGIKGGTITRGQGLPTVLVNWTQTGTGKIWVLEQSQTPTSNCMGVSDTLLVDVFESPGVLAVSGPQKVCAFSVNQTYALTGMQAGSVVNWTVTGGQISSGQGTNSITVNWQAAGSGLVEAQEVTVARCTSPVVSFPVQIENLPVPVVTTLTDPAICPSGLVRAHAYAVQQVAGASYKWLVTGGSILNGQNTNMVQVKWNGIGVGNKIGVVETNVSGCSSDTLWLPLRLDTTEPELKAVSVAEKDESQLQVLYNLNNAANYPYGFVAVQRLPSGKATYQAAAVALLNNRQVAFSYRNQTDGTWYRLAGRNLCGDSIYSRPHRAIYLANGESSQQGLVNLSWNNYEGWAGGATEYQVWRKADDKPYALLASLGAQATGFKDQVADAGFEQCFRIRAIAADGRESWSNSVCFAFENQPEFYNLITPNGDNQNDKFVIGKLQLYPENELTIYNRWGNQVYNTKNYQNEWPAHGLNDGVYYYYFTAAGKSYKGWVEVVH